MALVRALENRRRMEEREKKRLEARAERIANKEKRAEQRKMELELVEQIRKPIEDMELTGKSFFCKFITLRTVGPRFYGQPRSGSP